MLNIQTIVFSKDRAAQLDLFLNSQKKNFNVGPISVIYTYSNKEYELGYKLLAKKYSDVTFIEQVFDIKTDLLAFINLLTDCYSTEIAINLCTDDCVYYKPNKITSEEIYEILDEKTFCYSPRLGLNTTLQDYKTYRFQPSLQDYEHINNSIRWQYNKYNKLNNYGYPAHQDSLIVRIKDFNTMSNFEWKTMRDLEGGLSIAKRHLIEYKPFMASPTKSICVNIPTNNVQPGLHCSDKVFCSTEELNNKLLAGNSLSLEKMDFSNVIGAHQEILLRWENE